MPGPKNPKPPYPPEFRQQMVELVASGRRPSELAKEFGCHETSILSWVRIARAATASLAATPAYALRFANADQGTDQYWDAARAVMVTNAWVEVR